VVTHLIFVDNLINLTYLLSNLFKLAQLQQDVTQKEPPVQKRVKLITQPKSSGTKKKAAGKEASGAFCSTKGS
jgi:hypothetical protein